VGQPSTFRTPSITRERDWIPSPAPTLDAAGHAYEPLASLVTRELRDAIVEGRLRPGSPIRQEAVAREYGTSRIPVREALRQLENEGFVTIVPHSGARVATLDFEECLEVYKIRERIEPLAFSESVGRLTDQQLQTLSSLALEIEENVDDEKAWIDVDRRFHLGCYPGAPPRLARMIVGFWHSTQKYRRLLTQTLTADDYRAYHHEHRLMVIALAQGNAPAGEALVRLHIERSRMRLAASRELFDR
jgi:DNA-binding GntR family transcriptional regulator